jgi:two-component system response regulator RegX3
VSELLLVEDDETLREALSFLLGREGYHVTQAADGPSALAAFELREMDLVLLDLMIPDIPGTEVCRRIRLLSDVPIIMLTAKNDEADVVMGLELGADDYVTKPYSTPELLARIRTALRRSQGRSASLEPAMLQVSGLSMDVERHRVWVDGVEVTMPLREFTLLELLLRNAGRVLTRGTLLDRIWGADFFGDTKTLDVHIRRLRGRIEEDPAAPRRLVTVRGLGYRLEDTP